MASEESGVVSDASSRDPASLYLGRGGRSGVLARLKARIKFRDGGGPDPDLKGIEVNPGAYIGESANAGDKKTLAKLSEAEPHWRLKLSLDDPEGFDVGGIRFPTPRHYLLYRMYEEALSLLEGGLLPPESEETKRERLIIKSLRDCGERSYLAASAPPPAPEEIAKNRLSKVATWLSCFRRSEGHKGDALTQMAGFARTDDMWEEEEGILIALNFRSEEPHWWGEPLFKKERGQKESTYVRLLREAHEMHFEERPHLKDLLLMTGDAHLFCEVPDVYGWEIARDRQLEKVRNVLSVSA
jgi:predicted NAD-dependent protein-ADP-ribosyltransferase YbiA (DUF1768 family)